MVYVPATHLAPGVVELHATPVPGRIDVGAWPSGRHPLAAPCSLALRHAGFRSIDRDDIARWMYGKLLTNLAGVVQALCGSAAADDPVIAAAVAEAEACYAAAGIDAVTVEHLVHRVGLLELAEIDGSRRPGGSTWQSLARGKPLECRYLNGEIVALGATHGVPTPVNAALVATGEQAHAEGWAVGVMAPADLAARCGLGAPGGP